MNASQTQFVASAHNNGFSGIRNSGNNFDAWIPDSIIASPRSATPLYSRLSAVVVNSCFIFFSAKLSDLSLFEFTAVI